MSQPDGTHALLIDKAAAADAGKYGVVAVNDKGESGSSAELTVASKYALNKEVKMRKRMKNMYS